MSRTDRINPKAAFALVLCGTVLGIAGTDLVLPAIPGLPAALGGTPAAAQLVLAAFVAGVPPSAAGKPGTAGRTRSVPAMPSTVPQRTSAKAALGLTLSVRVTVPSPHHAREAIEEETAEDKIAEHPPAFRC